LKRPLGRPSERWEKTIKIDLGVMVCEDGMKIAQWLALVLDVSQPTGSVAVILDMVRLYAYSFCLQLNLCREIEAVEN
jgi:hypothetical protein